MTPKILLDLFYSDKVVLGCDTFTSVLLIALISAGLIFELVLDCI